MTHREVEGLRDSRIVPGGFKAVTAARLARELIGAVGRRVDLFALFEAAEAIDSE